MSYLVTKTVREMSKLGKIGAIFWTAVFIIAIPHCYQAKENTRKFITEPRAGDLYVVQVAYIDGGGYEGKDTRLVGIMKLVEINENILSFNMSETAYTRRGSLYLIKKYSDDIIRLQYNDVLELYDKGIIEEIKRK